MSWNISSASTPGTSHERNGLLCQDDHAYTQAGHYLVLAVADGAGSAPHSDNGANTAVRATTSYLAGALQGHRHNTRSVERLLYNTAKHAREAIKQLAQRDHRPVHEYATTLLAAILSPTHVGILQQGDGAIVGRDNDGLAVLTTPQDREYVNEVTFLTSDNYEDELHILVRPRRGLNAIALVTDGIESISIKRTTNTAHPGFYLPLFAQHTTEDLQELLSSTPVCERTDDDKTILIATEDPNALP